MNKEILRNNSFIFTKNIQIKLKSKLYKKSNYSCYFHLYKGKRNWRVTKTDMKSLSSFHHNCLKQICKIFWPNTITNTNLLKLTNSTCILNQIRQKRLRWLGHVLRMDRSAIPKIALRWTPANDQEEDQKQLGEKTIENELKSLDLTWGEAEARAKNRAEWQHLVLTLCSDGSGEDIGR